MKFKVVNSIINLSFLFLLFFNQYATAEVASCHNQKEFKIFDATLYQNKPDLTKYGIQFLPAIDNFWRPQPAGDAVPTDSMVKKAIRSVNKKSYQYAFINIEHWPLKGKKEEIDISLKKYIDTIRLVKSELPNLKIGLYGMLPHRDYWRAQKPKTSDKYKQWQQENNILKAISKEVDFLLPSLYTFYADQKGWEKYAIENISEAKRISNNKPVYAFLWPDYHNSNKLLKGQGIERSYWRLQLETVKTHADGIVFWGGWKNGRAKWDENMPWWLETKKWLLCN